MKNWTPEGHLTDLALELRAAGETEAPEPQRIDEHLRGCAACRAREAEWRELFHALAALEPLEPSPGFDQAVMARVRTPEASAQATAWLAGLVRRLRPIAVGTAAAWTTAVLGAAIWLADRYQLSAAALFTRLAELGDELFWAAVIKVAASVQASGLDQLWQQTAGAVPGPGVLSAVALMTAVSGLAIWTLYRVAGYETSQEVSAHVF